MKSKLSIDTEHITHSRFFFFNDTATTEIYTLSLHDALPISRSADAFLERHAGRRGHTLRPHRGRDLGRDPGAEGGHAAADRKSTRLNSSHSQISYAVFCLKKKKSNTHDDYIHLYEMSIHYRS